MPIELFTGHPGNGKTAFMVERLMAEAKKADRPLFAAGIAGLVPGLATILDDPRQWNAHDPDGEPTCDCHGDGRLHAHKVPDGSLIFIDEAWKWFGHLHDASRQATPPHALALAEHRHRGIDFLWTSQGPNQIYPFVRSLIARHTHHVRRFGTHYVDLYAWEELNEDVKSVTKRENALKQVRMLPKETFDKYDSATQHTIKRRIPLKVWVLPLAIIAAIASGSYALAYFKPDAIAERLGGKAQPDALAAGAQTSETTGKPPAVVTPEQYVAQFVARVPEAPWTAPLYDGRSVTADPQVICAITGSGENSHGAHVEGGCSCFTEQGTPYVMADDDTRSGDARCRHVARWGQPYNPFKQEQRQDNERRLDERREPARGTGPLAAPVAGIPGPAGAEPAYGGFRRE